jgi:NAD(P)-dependent dehydrogenase (short-subunit alcohol dehydrogenase family)
MTELAGKVALVTGGGQGLGAAISVCLSEVGMRVVIADLNEARARSQAEELRSQGCHAEAVHLNVADEGSAAQVMRAVLEKHGHLDVLVNNAGTDVTKPVSELTFEEWDRVIAVNLRGPFVMSKLALEAMSRHGGGHIVNITSTAGRRAWPNASAYHASKWGVLGFSHALFTEARHVNVKVTAVVAGGMRTPFILDRFPDVDPNKLQDPRNVAETIRFVLAQPAETVIPEVLVLPLHETSWP